MPKLIAALVRRLSRTSCPASGIGVPEGSPDPEREDAEKCVFTLSADSEATVVDVLTLSSARADDAWIAAFCLAHNIHLGDPKQ